MSYVTATKQLLREDLLGLISSLTQDEETSPEFVRFEEFAWNQILQKYNTSVTDDHVRNCINGFVEKFLFHGFPQKAENLKNLISCYSSLEYFKNQSDGTIKWSLIHLLMRLSQRPTDAERDDPPLVIDLIRGRGSEHPKFDWASYLKEGWEKFQLPSDDETVLFSDEEDYRNDFDLNDIPSFREPSTPSRPKKKEPAQKLSRQESDKLCEQKIIESNRWIRNQYETPWWRDTTYSENPSSRHDVANFCQKSSEIRKSKGLPAKYVRILREYRILQEIIFALGAPNWETTYLFSCENRQYSVRPNISISSLSPDLFRSVMESQFCKYLPHIATLIEFNATISKLNLLDVRLCNTYIAYSKSIGDLLNNFRNELAATEEYWKKMNGVLTMRTISLRLKPWLECMEFLSHVHSKAVYSHFTQVETWKCSLRLLGVLLNEMKLMSNSRLKKVALGLFLNSVEIYLRIIGSMMKGTKNLDIKKEFLIYESQERKTLEVHKYTSLLGEHGICSSEFWDPFITSSFRAISSTHFITQLDKQSTFRSLNTDVGVLLADVIDGLMKSIPTNTVSLSNVQIEAKPIQPLSQSPSGKDVASPTFTFSRSTLGCNLMSDNFYYSYQPRKSNIAFDTPTDKFMKCLKDCDLTTFPISVFISNVFPSVIHKHMEPVGFAFDALIHEFKLLEHLQCLRKVFFLQILEPFALSLFHKVVEKTQKTCSWTLALRECILDHYDQKTADQYQCFVNQISLIDSSHPKFVHESLSFTKIVYQPEVYLKVLIPDSCIKAYNEIFRFLLQVKWAHYVICKQFHFRGIQESHQNIHIYKRMYLLRMRLVNTMTSLRNYFFSMDEKSFEDKIKRLCHEARDLQTIERAHKDFLLECKHRCFLSRKNECRIHFEALLVLSFKCVRLWWSRDTMTLDELETLEDGFFSTMLKLVVHLQKYEREFSGALGAHFSLLQDELATNLPSLSAHKKSRN